MSRYDPLCSRKLMPSIDKRAYLQIGELARMYNVSVQALRYYDRIGFLKPLYIDPITRYRYYSRNQGFLVSNKQLLQTAGFSLTEIKEFLNKKSVEEITLLYKKKGAEINNQIQELQKKKKQIAFYLDFFTRMLFVDHAVKTRGMKGIDRIKLKHISPQRKVCIRDTVIFDYRSMMFLYNQLLQIIFENQLRVENHLMTIFHGDYGDLYHKKVDIELCMVVTGGKKSISVLEKFPYEHYVSCIHKGKYPSSIATYNRMLQWADKKNYQIIGPVMHVLIVSIAAAKSPQDTIFEIRLPVSMPT